MARWPRLVIAVAGMVALLTMPAHAEDTVAAFYAGRTVQLVVGYGPGGGYDSYARLVARYIGAHIPGHPVVLPQNMPGAGSLKSALYLANIAPRDGSVFGTFSRGILTQPLFDARLAETFDPRKLTWLGSAADEVGVCAFSKASGVRSLADMRRDPALGPILLGGTSAGADSDVWGNVLHNLFGFPLKLVTGYPGGSDVTLAIERGEVAGHCGWSLSSLLSERPAALEAGDFVITLQIAAHKSPLFPKIPLITDLATSPEQAEALALIVARQTVARPFAAPPDLPPDRAAALRAAFAATLQDPDLLAEARQMRLEINPVDAAAVQEVVRDAYATPPAVVGLAAKALSDSGD